MDETAVQVILIHLKTQAELTQAMSDPEYGKDQDYTLSVYKRLEDC